MTAVLWSACLDVVKCLRGLGAVKVGGLAKA